MRYEALESERGKVRFVASSCFTGRHIAKMKGFILSASAACSPLLTCQFNFNTSIARLDKVVPALLAATIAH